MNAEAKTTAEKTPLQEAGMTKFDAPVLKGMESTAVLDRNNVVFMPSSMAEAMEVAKLMSQSTFVAPCLRGKPGDCLAVVLQSCRWGADPFAVGNKVYFVNDRMAFEAQLVDAILNTSRVLDGRLEVEWDGKDAALVCTVTGKIKGDPKIHKVWQEINTLTVKNSPLWKSSPRQQIGYYTKRMWARLHAPEVLLGIYTPDDFYEQEQKQSDGSYVARSMTARPTRAGMAALQEREQTGGQPAEGSAAPAPEAEQSAAGHTQNQAGEGDSQGEQSAGDESNADEQAIRELVTTMTDLINGQGFSAGVDQVLETYKSDLEWLKEIAPAKHDEIEKVIAAKREKLKNRGRK